MRALVANDPLLASARTSLSISLQLWMDHFRPSKNICRLLCGPTHDVWLSPWLSYLRRINVAYRLGCQAQKLCVRNGRIDGVFIRIPHGRERIEADYYALCVPAEQAIRLLDKEICRLDPRLARLCHLRTAWMLGAQLFLRRDLPVVQGHVILVDSPWAITLISQAQFWQSTDLSHFGDGKVRGILSLCISDWNRPGRFANKPARQCSQQGLQREIWRELQDHFRGRGIADLRERDIVAWYFPDSLARDSRGRWHNREPLLINTVGSWEHRPEPVTAINNLFLAADYVRTHTDLATMEAANEAARLATNGILAAAGPSADPCDIWPLAEPAIFAPFKALDQHCFSQGRAHLLAEVPQVLRRLVRSLPWTRPLLGREGPAWQRKTPGVSREQWQPDRVRFPQRPSYCHLTPGSPEVLSAALTSCSHRNSSGHPAAVPTSPGRGLVDSVHYDGRQRVNRQTTVTDQGRATQ